MCPRCPVTYRSPVRTRTLLLVMTCMFPTTRVIADSEPFEPHAVATVGPEATSYDLTFGHSVTGLAMRAEVGAAVGALVPFASVAISEPLSSNVLNEGTHVRVYDATVGTQLFVMRHNADCSSRSMSATDGSRASRISSTDTHRPPGPCARGLACGWAIHAGSGSRRRADWPLRGRPGFPPTRRSAGHRRLIPMAARSPRRVATRPTTSRRPRRSRSDARSSVSTAA